MADANRQPAKYPGVYYRESAKRKDVHGKPDLVYDISYKTREGKKTWEKVGRKSDSITALVARDIRAERMQEVLHGKVVNPVITPEVVSGDGDESSAMTFEEAWQLYYDKWVVLNCARPDNEACKYNRHVGPRFAASLLSEIKTLDIENFKQDLLKKLSPKSTQHVLALIRSMYNRLKEWELYDGPTPIFKMPKVDNARLRFLTKEEADRLLAALKPRIAFWWRVSNVSLNTGLRLGEILGLTWGDLDFATKTIHVRHGKTGYRVAHMNNTIKAVFEEMPRGLPSELLFPSKQGGKLEETGVGNTFFRTIKSLGLNDDLPDQKLKAVFHTLRHTFASWLAIKGVPLYTISKLMGHSNMTMTNRYAHLCPDAKQAAVALLDE